MVRPVHPNDAADLYAIITHPQALRTLVQLPSMEFAETEEWIKAPKPGQHRLVAEADGRAVGSVSVSQHQNPRLAHGGQLGLMVHYDYWGKGVGSALMAAILDLADNWLNLKRVELDVFAHNPAAIHLYEKFGFELEGTRRCVLYQGGQWWDDLAMARLRGFEGVARPVDVPPAPRPSRQPPPGPVTIRPPRIEDAAGLYALFRHPAVCRTTLQLPSQEIGKTEERLNAHLPGLHRFVAEVDGRVVGMIILIQKKPQRLAHIAGLGMMVAPDYWGQGIGSRLMEAAVDLADNWLNLKRIELDVNTDNPAGVRLYEKFGFVIEGRKRFQAYGDGRWADSYFMARIQE
ncbi:MAG: GNAT family N-acetyltransferase [Chloroflexi bacterium]|nr:GNAT family N-acetyltransferase [Chloroflexota bacterium]MCI0643654.1 GNAT family N-acetyltransferase [Chloroflexota bacterium]